MLNRAADVDRLARITGRLNRLGITFERFEAATPPADLPPYKDPELHSGHWACGLSHILLLREIYRRGIDCALVLEDDAILRDDFVEQLAAASNDIRQSSWNLLYLGCHVVREGDGFRHGRVIAVQDAFHTHAYIIRLDSIPKIIMAIAQRLAAFDGPFDEMRFPGLIRARLMPTLAIQEPGYSHTTGGQKDRTRQYFPLAEQQAEFRSHCDEFRDQTRLGVATLWTDNVADIASITLPTKRQYCRRWRLPYIEHHGWITSDRPAAWSKLPLLIEELPRFDWIFWSDADAMFMNQDIDLRDFLDDDADLIWTADESGPNTGNFFIRNCAATYDLLKLAGDLFEQTAPDYRAGRFKGMWEQSAIREVIESGAAPSLHIKTIEKRSINSYDTDYQPGDLVLHLPGYQKLQRLRRFGDFQPDPQILNHLPEICTACQLRPNLWLGGKEPAKDGDWLKARGITAIVNVARECTDPDCGITRHCEPLEDVEGNTPEMIESAKLKLCALLEAGEIVYLHCVWGLNRSVYIASHVLAAREHRPFDEVFAEIQSIRGPHATDKLRKLYG